MPYLLRVRRFYATLSGRNLPRFLTNDSTPIMRDRQRGERRRTHSQRAGDVAPRVFRHLRCHVAPHLRHSFCGDLQAIAADGGPMQALRILCTLLCLGVLGGCYIVPGPPSSGGYAPGAGASQGEYRGDDPRTTEDERREYWQQRRREREYWDRHNAAPGPTPSIPPPPPGPPPPPPPDVRR